MLRDEKAFKWVMENMKQDLKNYNFIPVEDLIDFYLVK